FGMLISRPTKRWCAAPPPSTRRGTSRPPTTNGSRASSCLLPSSRSSKRSIPNFPRSTRRRCARSRACARASPGTDKGWRRDRPRQPNKRKGPVAQAPPRSEDSGDKGQSSKALAQMLGKLIALVLVVILALLIERYCSYKPPAFGPDAKISAIDGDSIRAGNGDE